MRPSLPHTLFVLLSITCTAPRAGAQHANFWFFGDRAGVDFSTGTPVALANGMMRAYEACASVSDDNGDLLFYTNGGRLNTATPYWDIGGVWDRSNVMMPNGSLQPSGGCNSAKQGALIVQDPGNAHHYYLFTLDCAENGMAGGLRYCEVDMTLNGGLGDVTSIGTPLLASVTESMIGIRHANGVDAWVLVHGLDNSDYHAFLVTASGISGPVTTTIGPIVDDQPGDMAVDLASTRVHFSSTDHSTLLEFDPATGVLSNMIDLGRSVTGCAFAPGGQYLYTCEFLGTKRVFQYDLLASDIAASEQIIGTGTYGQPALQLAPNGKIYVAHWSQPHLGVINNPDLGGAAADLQEVGIDLLGHDCGASLPNFMNDLLQPVGMPEHSVEMGVQCTVQGEELMIHCRGLSNGGRFSIYGNDGAVLREGRSPGSTTAVPIGDLPSGLYVVRVAGEQRWSAAAAFAVVR